jgi:hypothetical protein
MSYVSNRAQALHSMRQPIVAWLWRNALRLEGQTIRNAPKGASGTLRKGVRAYVDEAKLVGVVSVHPEYSKFVEGIPVVTKKHFTPWSVSYMFQRWGKQRGFDTSRGGLLTWGYRNPFFTKAIESVAPIAMAELRTMGI